MEASGTITVPVESLDEYWRLYPLGDVHMGNRGCHLRLFRQNVETIAEDERCGVILMGDQIDAIGPSDPRFDASVLDDRSMTLSDLAAIGEALYGSFVTEVEPIRSRILVALMGNHEQKLMVHHNQAWLHSHFCRDIDAINGGMSGLFDLLFRDPAGKTARFRIYAHHGSGAAATPGGKMNRLVKFMDMADADIFLVGHVHEQLDHVRTRITANRTCTKLGHRDEVGVLTGTYLRTYTQGVCGYGERAGYHPTSVGSPVIEIVPSTRQVGVSWMR